MGEIMAKTNETEDVNQKINTIRENRRTMNDENMLDTKISLSVKSIFSVVIFIAFMAGAFLAGRYVFPSGTSLIDFGSAAATFGGSLSEDADSTDSNTELADTSDTTDNSDSEADSDAESDDSAEVANDTAGTIDTEDSAEPETSDETKNIDEKIITEGYEKVFLEFTRTPAFEWKSTWGKITTVYYTITNNEEGTIKPSQFRVIAEGYDTPDFIKTVDVPTIDETINSGKVAKHGVDVKLQYSESVTDPTNMQLTLQLLDEDGDLIDAINQEFNLKE